MDNVKICVLIDSGATHSIVGPSMIQKLPKLKENLKTVEPQVSAKGVNGTLITYEKEITFKLTIEEEDFETYAYYSPILNISMTDGL